MSEKRFKKMDTIIDPFPIWDTVEEKGYNCTDTLDLLVDLLNEQQATINKVYELLEEADIFSDEATEHDIKAYIELQEFDNKDAYYLACGIKKAIKRLLSCLWH